MTSTNLFINLQKEDIKRRFWIIAVGFLGLLLMKPVYLLMTLDKMKEYQMNTNKEIMDFVIQFFSGSGIQSVAFIIIIAFVLGISGYMYLFSKKKTDFYHALPIKREKLFAVFYIDGLCIYLLLYSMIQIICMIIVTLKGFMTGVVMMEIIKAFCVEGMYFLFIYHTVILAVMMTGNLLVSIAGSGVFLLYIPMIAQTAEEYFTRYFKSYYRASYETFPLSKIAGLSAITSYMRYMDLISNQDINNQNKIFLLLLTAFCMSVLFLLLAIWLYKKRPSEIAEKAMAFKKTEMIIRILLVIPAAMLGGILLYSFANEGSEIWFWFGLFFTGILAHCAIEIIYCFDFKAFGNHKMQLILSMVVTSIITICFQLDIFGYDSYIPPLSKVESMAIGFDNIDGEVNGSNIDIIGGKLVNDNYMTYEGYQLRHMKLTDFETVQSLAIAGIQGEKNQNNKDWINKQYNYVQYTIKYNMKNGKEIYRTYSIPVESVLPQIEKIYNSKEYKEGAYPLTAIVNSKVDIKKIEIYNVMENKTLTISSDTANSVLSTYLEELSKLTIDEIQEETPILRIAPEVTISGDTSELYGYYIYPSFKSTLAELEKLGLNKAEAVIEKLQPEDIRKIVASGSKEVENYSEDDYKEITYNNDGTKDSTDKINDLCSKLYASNFAWSNNILKPYEQNITFEVIFKDVKESENSIYMNVGKGQMPEFVYKDFDNN